MLSNFEVGKIYDSPLEKLITLNILLKDDKDKIVY